MTDTQPREALVGHLPESHPLSPRRAFQSLSEMSRAIVDYDPQTAWEQDLASLPKPLQELRRHARNFAERELHPLALQGDLHPHDKEIESVVLKRAAESGILLGFVPRPVGSANVELMDYPLQWGACIQVEELCAACGGWGLLLSANALGTVPILLSGDKKAMKRFLIPAVKRNCAGEPYLFAYAITEPGAGSDVEDGRGAAGRRPGTVASRRDDGWVLNGRKVFISGGDIADAVTVFSALEGEGIESWTCFLVEKGTPGFCQMRNELKMGQRASGATELEFKDVFVPDDHVIGGMRNGWALNRASLNFSRLPVAAIALGIARGAVEGAIDFVCRHQLGGKRLIDFQEVQLDVADMIAETSSMRAMIWQHASRKVPRQASSSSCKVICSDRAVRVCEQAMELLSNHGVLHRNHVEKGFRDARLTQIYEGTNEINRLAIIEDWQSEFLIKINEG